MLEVPEPVRVAFAAILFGGVSLADINVLIQIAVGVSTFIYIVSKTIRVWRGKKKGQQ
jgi:hypothetical protein